MPEPVDPIQVRARDLMHRVVDAVTDLYLDRRYGELVALVRPIEATLPRRGLR